MITSIDGRNFVLLSEPMIDTSDYENGIYTDELEDEDYIDIPTYIARAYDEEEEPNENNEIQTYIVTFDTVPVMGYGGNTEYTYGDKFVDYETDGYMKLDVIR